MKLNIIAVGMTIKQGDDVQLLLEGDMPADCVVVFMDKESWEKFKELSK